MYVKEIETWFSIAYLLIDIHKKVKVDENSEVYEKMYLKLRSDDRCNKNTTDRKILHADENWSYFIHQQHKHGQ
jgi:hypothetical protein